jgi:hypothetical protein
MNYPPQRLLTHVGGMQQQQHNMPPPVQGRAVAPMHQVLPLPAPTLPLSLSPPPVSLSGWPAFAFPDRLSLSWGQLLGGKGGISDTELPRSLR